MLKFTSIVGYTSCGPTYIESFFTIFGQCINVLNYKSRYVVRIAKYNVKKVNLLRKPFWPARRPHL